MYLFIISVCVPTLNETLALGQIFKERGMRLILDKGRRKYPQVIIIKMFVNTLRSQVANPFPLRD